MMRNKINSADLVEMVGRVADTLQWEKSVERDAFAAALTKSAVSIRSIFGEGYMLTLIDDQGDEVLSTFENTELLKKIYAAAQWRAREGQRVIDSAFQDLRKIEIDALTDGGKIFD